MKIIYCTIPMKEKLDKASYKVIGNSKLQNDREVIFPINLVLEKILTKADDVKVVLLAKKDINNNYINNIRAFKNELLDVNKSIGANIVYKTIEMPFEEGNSSVHNNTLKSMIQELEEDCEIYCDITYGAKSTPILMMNMLNFAEKFYNAEIKDIVYGQADFIKDDQGNIVATNQTLCNLRSIYYLNSITNSLQCDCSEEAKEVLNILLDM